MFIERLRLKGFKSFGGSHELTFSPGFTAIVGPNGSGKSNILDGLRWVLGEGSPNCLRITRQSDLLFQGSISLPTATETEVSLCIREDPKICTIKREFSPETGTSLFVDGMRIRLQDLDDVKRQWHMEGEQFAFIGQGEVAEAIHHRPQQRRSILEALFGIDQYRKKREDANQKLKFASEELARLETLVSELTSRRDEIAAMVTIAEKARRLLDELDEKRRGYYFSRRAFLERELYSFQSRIHALERRKNRAAEWETIWKEGLSFYQSLFNSYEQQKKVHEERTESLGFQRETLRRQCFATALTVKSARERLIAQKEEKRHVEEVLSKVDEEVTLARGTSYSLTQDFHKKKEEVSALWQKLSNLRSSLRAERQRRQEYGNEYARVESECARILSRLQARSEALDKNEKELEEAKNKVFVAEKETETYKKEFEYTHLSYKKVIERHGEIYVQCQRLATSLSQLKKNVDVLENQLETVLENTEQRLYPEPVRVILAAQKLGKLPIQIKLAAEAFKCEEKLAAPLEAYLGGRQFWLFVKSLEEAQLGIELVKQKRAGRITFLPLEQCHPRNPDYGFPLPCQGTVGWATDLIASEQLWGPAVNHLLGDLLIVEEYDVGMNLARAGASFPIVTLQGDVFTVGGSVSGGKFRKTGGAIERRLQIEDLEKNLKDKRGSLERVVSLLQEAEELECVIAKERAFWKEKEQEAEKKLLSHSIRFERQREEVVRLEKERSFFLNDVEDSGKLLKRTQHSLKELEEAIASFGDFPDVTELERELASAKGEEAVLCEKVKSGEVLINRIESEAAQLTERLRSLSGELENTELSLDEGLDRLRELGVQSYELWKNIKEIDSERARLSAETESLVERTSLLRERCAEAHERVQIEEEKVKDSQRQVDSARLELNQIISLWEDAYHYPGTENISLEEYEEESLAHVRRLEKKVRELGDYDLGVLSENESLKNRLAFLTVQIEDVHGGIGELQSLIQSTDERVGLLFGEALKNTDERFNSLFQRLFGGGEAHLELEEGLSLWEAGVDIFARPPGKRLQNLAQLSGGEQSLTAIALLFATMEVAEVPLAILDEVDASLDEYNLLRFIDLVSDYAMNMQILAMTHRRSTMERADVLYGVTMDEPGLSKVIGVHLDEWTE